ncbi:hypothetical protein L6R53_12400 [Myxococcota bacterium]|nr:hypothetical protein [Myxococcota bacterium]
MKRTLATLLTIGALALACGEGDDAPTTGGTTVETPPPPPPPAAVADTNAGLDARWNGMGLPVGDAQVLLSDETIALMAWEAGDFGSSVSRWKESWTKAGYTVTDSFTDTDFEAAIYTKGDAELGWAIGADQGAVLVYLEDLKVVPAEESTVRQAKTGTRRVTRNTGPRTLRRADGTSGGGATGGERTLHRGGQGGNTQGGNNQGGGGRTLGR